MKNYCLILGDNFEDIEALAQIDLFRRAGIKIDIFGAGSVKITSRSNVTYITDYVFNKSDDIKSDSYSGILLPGGPGVSALLNNNSLIELIREFYNSDKLIFAICSAPELLDKAGILSDKNFTCFPDSINKIKTGKYVDRKVVVDGNLITSKSAGTAIDAGLKLIEIILSKADSDIVAKKIVYIPD